MHRYLKSDVEAKEKNRIKYHKYIHPSNNNDIEKRLEKELESNLKFSEVETNHIEASYRYSYWLIIILEMRKLK